MLKEAKPKEQIELLKNILEKDTKPEEQIELLKNILQKDAMALLEPVFAVLGLIIILIVSTWWKNAVFFLFFLALWAISWILRRGIIHALVAIFRLPYNAISLYRMKKRLKSSS